MEDYLGYRLKKYNKGIIIGYTYQSSFEYTNIFLMYHLTKEKKYLEKLFQKSVKDIIVAKDFESVNLDTYSMNPFETKIEMTKEYNEKDVDLYLTKLKMMGADIGRFKTFAQLADSLATETLISTLMSSLKRIYISTIVKKENSSYIKEIKDNQYRYTCPYIGTSSKWYEKEAKGDEELIRFLETCI